MRPKPRDEAIFYRIVPNRYLKRARYQSMKNASLQLSTVFQMDDHSDGEDEMMTLGLDGNRRRTLDNDL